MKTTNDTSTGLSDCVLRLSASLRLSSCVSPSFLFSFTLSLPGPSRVLCVQVTAWWVSLDFPALSSDLSATHNVFFSWHLLQTHTHERMHTCTCSTLSSPFFCEGPHFTQVFDFSPPFFSSMFDFFPWSRGWNPPRVWGLGRLPVSLMSQRSTRLIFHLFSPTSQFPPPDCGVRVDGLSVLLGGCESVPRPCPASHSHPTPIWEILNVS